MGGFLKILNFNIWGRGGVQKNEYFLWKYEDFGGSLFTWTNFVGHSYVLGSPLRLRYRLGTFLGYAKISSIWVKWGVCLIFFFFFFLGGGGGGGG